MAEYLLACHGEEAGARANEGAERREVFIDWIGELGDAVVSSAALLGRSKTVCASSEFDTAESDRRPDSPSSRRQASMKRSNLPESVRSSESGPSKWRKQRGSRRSAPSLHLEQMQGASSGASVAGARR